MPRVWRAVGRLFASHCMAFWLRKTPLLKRMDGCLAKEVSDIPGKATCMFGLTSTWNILLSLSLSAQEKEHMVLRSENSGLKLG